jgi:hypothetical protein
MSLDSRSLIGVRDKLRENDGFSNGLSFVIPAKAGIQKSNSICLLWITGYFC